MRIDICRARRTAYDTGGGAGRARVRAPAARAQGAWERARPFAQADGYLGHRGQDEAVELFTAIKDRAIKSKDDEAWNRCDECIQLWTKMVVADAEHEDCIVSNVEALQKNCAQITDDLHAALERLAASRSPSRRASRMGQDAAYMSQVHGQVRVMRVELDRMVGPPPHLPY